MRLISYFLPQAANILVYMLQQVEYSSVRFLKWVITLPNLLKVKRRQELDKTSRAKITLLVAYLSWAIPIVVGLTGFFVYDSYSSLLFLPLAPLICVISIALFNTLLGRLIVKPTESREITQAKNKLKNMQATKIAVIGSYGKTTMKDLLATVLSEGKKVAATPGNKNVLISHARWANQLSGDEEVLIFEYGEAKPGDIASLASFSQPEIAFVTGLAPAHMDGYKTLTAVAKDFQAIAEHVSKNNIFVNADNPQLSEYFSDSAFYSQKSVDGWAVQISKLTLDGLSFTMLKETEELKLHSGLLGAHNVGPLAAAAAIARRLGLSLESITKGIAATKPFEHRMQPYQLGGAWIIDDTYNGNLEGMKAGLALLKHLPAKRKIYVTPGLVEQGDLTAKVHEELGEAIAAAQPDIVVLMKHSVTGHIQKGLENSNYAGELKVEDNPLEFYMHLDHFVAAGDLVLLQNDWPDSYS